MPHLIDRPALTVVGLAARTDNAREADPDTALIPGLWARFFGAGFAERLPASVADDDPVSVYTDYASDHTGAYTVVVGKAVSSEAPVPEGMVSIDVPAARCLVFPAEGAMPQAVVEAWQAVWAHFAEPTAPDRAYTADLERYRGGGAAADLLIAVV